VRTVVPFDHERREPFFRRTHMVGHDGDGIVEPNDLTHALDGFGRCIVHALHTTPKTGDCASVAIFIPGSRTSIP
jgi:hypothetical protein